MKYDIKKPGTTLFLCIFPCDCIKEFNLFKHEQFGLNVTTTELGEIKLSCLHDLSNM